MIFQPELESALINHVIIMPWKHTLCKSKLNVVSMKRNWF